MDIRLRVFDTRVL